MRSKPGITAKVLGREFLINKEIEALQIDHSFESLARDQADDYLDLKWKIKETYVMNIKDGK